MWLIVTMLSLAAMVRGVCFPFATSSAVRSSSSDSEAEQPARKQPRTGAAAGAPDRDSRSAGEGVAGMANAPLRAGGTAQMDSGLFSVKRPAEDCGRGLCMKGPAAGPSSEGVVCGEEGAIARAGVKDCSVGGGGSGEGVGPDAGLGSEARSGSRASSQTRSGAGEGEP